MTANPAAAHDRTASQRAVAGQNWELADCFAELVGKILGQADRLAQRLGVPVPFIKVLHSLDCPMAMKELGKRIHCDPSFVTLVADMLETRGLARREPHPADRRVKNLVLTDDGVAMKQQVEAEMTAEMPWTALDPQEREQLLALIRKMLAAGSNGPDGAGDAVHMDASGPLASLLVTAMQESVQQASAHNPPASTGEVKRS